MRKTLSILLILILLALFLTSCASPDYKLTVEEFSLQKEAFKTRLILIGDESKKYAVKITARLKLVKNGEFQPFTEDLKDAVISNLEIVREKPVEKIFESLKSSTEDNGYTLVVEMIDGDITTFEFVSATNLNYTLKMKKTRIQLDNGKTISVEDEILSMGRVLYIKEPISIDGEFSENGYKLNFENTEQLKGFDVNYQFVDLNGNVVDSGVLKEKIVIPYDKLSVDGSYRVFIIVSDEVGEIERFERDITFRFSELTKLVTERDDENPENVHITVNTPIQGILKYSKVSYEIYDGNTVLIDKTDVEDPEDIVISGVPNDKLYDLKLYIEFPTDEERVVEGKVRIHIMKRPSVDLNLATVRDSMDEGSLMQGLKIRFSDLEGIESYLGTPGKDYILSARFYTKDGDSWVFNKHLTDLFNQKVENFNLISGADFYVKYDYFDDVESMIDTVMSIKDRKIKVIVSINKLNGRWSETFDNPEVFTMIESAEVGPVQSVVFAQYIPNTEISIKRNRADIRFESGVLKEMFEDAPVKKLLIAFYEKLTGRWGYYEYDMSYKIKQEDYNGINVDISVEGDDESGLEITVAYNSEGRELMVYYIFNNGFNKDYSDWEASDHDQSKLITLVKKYGAYIGGVLRKKSYTIEGVFEDYFNPPFEISPHEILLTKKETRWVESGYDLHEAIVDGAVVKFVLKVLDEHDQVIQSLESGLGQSRFLIDGIQPGMRYKLKVEFYSPENELIGAVSSSRLYVKYLMLPTPSFEISEVEKDLSNQKFSVKLNINCRECYEQGVTSYYALFVNKSQGKYEILTTQVNNPIIEATDLSLGDLWVITVVPWIDGKWNYLREVTGDTESENFVDYLENHIVEAILRDWVGSAREYYYKVIIDNDVLPIRRLLVRNTTVQPLDVEVHPKLYLIDRELALKIVVNVHDPNGDILNEVEDYETVVGVEDISGNTINESSQVFMEDFEVTLDLGRVREIETDLLYVYVYPVYKISGETKYGDRFVKMLKKPQEVIWPDIEVIPDPVYREEDAGIIVVSKIEEGQKFRFKVKIYDESTTKISEWEFTAEEGELRESTGGLYHGAEYKVEIEAESLINPEYEWEKETEKEEYLNRYYGPYYVTTLPYIWPVEIERDLSTEFGERYAFVAIDPDEIKATIIPVWLKVNPAFSNSDILNLIEEIDVVYSDQPVESGELKDPKLGVNWTEDEIEKLFEDSNVDRKDIRGLKEGTTYNIRVETKLKYTDTILRSVIKNYTTKNYLKSPAEDDIYMEKDEYGNYWIVVKDFEKYTMVNGIVESQNFYKWKVYNKNEELIFPEEGEEDLGQISVEQINAGDSSMFEIRGDDLWIRLDILARFSTRDRIYLHFYAYCADLQLIDEIGQEYVQEKRGWEFVFEEGKMVSGPKVVEHGTM